MMHAHAKKDVGGWACVTSALPHYVEYDCICKEGGSMQLGIKYHCQLYLSCGDGEHGANVIELINCPSLLHASRYGSLTNVFYSRTFLMHGED